MVDKIPGSMAPLASVQQRAKSRFLNGFVFGGGGSGTSCVSSKVLCGLSNRTRSLLLSLLSAFAT